MDGPLDARLREQADLEAELAPRVAVLAAALASRLAEQSDDGFQSALLCVSRLQSRLLHLSAGPAVPNREPQLSRQSAAVLHRAVKLGRILGLLSASGDAVPLYRQRPRLADPGWAQRNVLDRALRRLTPVLNPHPQDASAAARGAFPDIPIGPGEFVEHLHAARRVAMAGQTQQPLRFLDVGCGSGLTVLLASELFDEAVGIEIDPGYVSAATELLRRAEVPNGRIEQADALLFDDYGAYDIIYFYRPLRDIDLLRQMERRILAQARPGTLLIAPYDLFDDRLDAYGCSRIAGRLFIAGVGPEAASEARRRAEHVGSAVLRTRDGHDPLDGYLVPLVSACEAMGLDVG